MTSKVRTFLLLLSLFSIILFFQNCGAKNSLRGASSALSNQTNSSQDSSLETPQPSSDEVTNLPGEDSSPSPIPLLPPIQVKASDDTMVQGGLSCRQPQFRGTEMQVKKNSSVGLHNHELFIKFDISEIESFNPKWQKAEIRLVLLRVGQSFQTNIQQFLLLSDNNWLENTIDCFYDTSQSSLIEEIEIKPNDVGSIVLIDITDELDNALKANEKEFSIHSRSKTQLVSSDGDHGVFYASKETGDPTLIPKILIQSRQP